MPRPPGKASLSRWVMATLHLYDQPLPAARFSGIGGRLRDDHRNRRHGLRMERLRRTGVGDDHQRRERIRQRHCELRCRGKHDQQPSSSVTLIVAGIPFNIQQLTVPSFIGSMPHLAAEGGWITTFTLVNKGCLPRKPSSVCRTIIWKSATLAVELSAAAFVEPGDGTRGYPDHRRERPR